ncbi:hypothetical protein RJ639_042987, partial [Escallonia herrerae]
LRRIGGDALEHEQQELRLAIFRQDARGEFGDGIAELLDDRLSLLTLDAARQIIQYADQDRPKNDRATILIDTIQTLMDLTAEVNRLKAECAALLEESSELTQEKNELREEKASLRSDVDTLNVQYQQRRVMFPWAPFDPSIVTAQPYSYPVPLPVPPGPITMHPSLPFPFIGNQNPGFIPNPCSTYIPYPTPANAHSDQPSTLQTSSSRIPNKHECRSKLSDREKCSNDGKGDDFIDVVTELELKTPGSTVQQVLAGDRKGKQPQRREKSIEDASCSSR